MGPSFYTQDEWTLYFYVEMYVFSIDVFHPAILTSGICWGSLTSFIGTEFRLGVSGLVKSRGGDCFVFQRTLVDMFQLAGPTWSR